MFTVQRELQLEMSHRLLNGEFESVDIHGHSYRIRLLLGSPRLMPTGEILPNQDDAIGFFFKRLQQQFDRCLMLHSTDPIVERLDGLLLKIVQFDDHPTAMILAQRIWVEAKAKFPKIPVIFITVHEGPDIVGAYDGSSHYVSPTQEALMKKTEVV